MDCSLESQPVVPRQPTPIHLRPTAPLAERVLLPGDPGRALALAQTLLEEPRMFNHHRGLWGYTGAAADGKLLTIQSTGMGGPSAAIVLWELIHLGVRRAIRVGTCGALEGSLKLGDLLIARASICADGTSRALGAGERIAADAPLTEALCSAAKRMQAGWSTRRAHAGTIVSRDLFYDPSPSPACQAVAPSGIESKNEPLSSLEPNDIERNWSATGALAVEMETSTLLAIGARTEIPVACVLAVSDSFDADGNRERIDDSALLSAAQAMGAVALTSLSG